MFRTSLWSSEVRCEVQKFISEFTSQFVNKGCDWLLNSMKPIKCLVYKPACEFWNELLNFATNFRTSQRSSESYNEKLPEIDCKTTNFDRFPWIQTRNECSKFPCQISNSDYAMFWLYFRICLVLIWTNFKSNLNVKIHCFCHVWTKMKNVYRRMGNGNAFCWEVKVCWYFIVKYVKCSLKSQDNSTQALTPELNAFLTSVFLNDYY